MRRMRRVQGLGLDTLSMDMTGDPQAAIAEGTTIVRVGTAIFGPRRAAGEPSPVSEQDLAVMRLLDEAHLQYPFYGSRRLSDRLGERGVKANRKRVRRSCLMRCSS